MDLLAPQHNKLGLGGPGLRFEDLYLVALIPLEKHKRMYECVLGYREISNDTLRRPWSERYSRVFMSQEDTDRGALSVSSTNTPLESLADQYSSDLDFHYGGNNFRELGATNAACFNTNSILSCP